MPPDRKTTRMSFICADVPRRESSGPTLRNISGYNFFVAPRGYCFDDAVVYVFTHAVIWSVLGMLGAFLLPAIVLGYEDCGGGVRFCGSGFPEMPA